MDYEWYTSVYDDATEIARLMGIEIKDIGFSGFSSQGDGAHFTGRLGYRKGCVDAVKAHAPCDIELHAIAQDWQQAQAAAMYQATGTVRQDGHYSHAYCTSFAFERPDWRTGYDMGLPSAVESALISAARRFMNWIYSQLEAEYEFQEAWQCASRWQDSRDAMATARHSARALVKDMRAARASGIGAAESICAALRDTLRRHAETWQTYRNERNQMDSDFWYRPAEGQPRLSVQAFAELYL